MSTTTENSNTEQSTTMESNSNTDQNNVEIHKSALTGKEGVCRIEVARVEWMVAQPWQRTPQSKSSGTGFVIEGNRILTNAHVVRSAMDIRVRKHGSTLRFPARVVVYAPDVDLALLKICGEQEEMMFFAVESELSSNGGSGTNGGEEDEHPVPKKQRRSSLALELSSGLPALQESVHVVGFPTGGRTICVTEGVVSRIDLVSASAFNTMLAIQVDSAINAGNSGGPAFNANGQVTGVAVSKITKKHTDNIGYLIPADVVRAFLGRCNDTDGTYTLSPNVPYRWHGLENQSLRMFHCVPDTIQGVLLTSVCESVQHALQVGDVVTKIDGTSVANDGQVVLRGDELIQHYYMLRCKHVDASTVFTVYRNGQEVECQPCILKNIPSICLRWAHVDYQPDYLILGALVLLPLSWSLRGNKKFGTRLAGTCIDWCRKWPSQWEGIEGLVVLTDVFAHDLTFSYSRPWRRVLSYNGIGVKSLGHLRDLWQTTCNEMRLMAGEGKTDFVRIELENDDDVVFDIKAAMAAEVDILGTHQIPRASHISKPNPKYK